MQINTTILKTMCSKLLNALDTDSSSALSDTVELCVENKVLSLTVAGDDYRVRTEASVDNEDTIRTVVNADVFLKLIGQTTTDNINLVIEDTTLVITGNGEYKLPMIYEGDELIKFPDFSIQNETSTFSVTKDVLASIVGYNAKELSKGTAMAPIQKMYYVDKDGCITFTSGACVNKFSLGEDVTFLLQGKTVKLFKLFLSTEGKITVKLGKDTVDGIVIDKITLSDSMTEVISTIVTNPDTVSMVPKDAIRGMLNDEYTYTVSISRQALLGIINRLTLFTPTTLYAQPWAYFEFGGQQVKILDKNKHNVELLPYVGTVLDIDEGSEKTLLLDMSDVKSAIDLMKKDTFTFKFGNGKAVVISQDNISNIIPECVD